jgi:protein toll
MTGNAISNLSKAVESYTRHPTNMTHYQDIKRLVLTGNSIGHFSHACLPPRLTLLDLDHNRLGSFTQADVNFFDQLIKDQGLKLKLGGNPYNCTCESRPLFNFIKNQGSKVLDLDAVRMQCDRDERKLWQIEKLEEFCTTGLSTAEVGGIVAVLVLLCIVIVLLVLWTCYSEHLTIWVYSKPCFRVLFTEDLIDQDKPYDVFLSYSHEDEAWVEQVLAAGLENPSEGGEGMQYRCCIHTRDWKVGEMIPDQIIQSVESSRRTLIVLSKAYVDSMWTKLEFRAAHTQALQDKTQRVILVVRDQDVIADKESMEEDLQRYISLNTYLDCEDPWFWQKLRYALPHRGGFRGRKRTRRETDRMELMRSQAELELGKRSPSPRVLDSKALQKEVEQPTSAVASSGPKGLTGGPRNGLVSPIQSNGLVSNGLPAYSNGHIVNQVVPA